MKAIIVAAGRGSRMGTLTENLPKCLAIRVGEQSLFDYQVATFRDLGISELAVVCGYRSEKFPPRGIRYYWNQSFENNNILESLMSARREISGEVLITYSDIFFTPSIPKALMQSPADITIAVGLDWESHYEERTEHPMTEAELVQFDKNKKVRRIGKIFSPASKFQGEFMGIMKMNDRGQNAFVFIMIWLKRSIAGNLSREPLA